MRDVACGADGAVDASAPLPLWPAPDDPLARTRLAGLEPERRALLDYHVHAHLDVFVDGRPVLVPVACWPRTSRRLHRAEHASPRQP